MSPIQEWTTAGLCGARAYRAWRVVCDEVLDDDTPSLRPPDDFAAGVRRRLVGSAALVEVWSRGLDYWVSRDRDRAARTASAELVGFFVPIATAGALRQRREIDYHPRDVVLVRGDEPMVHSVGRSSHDVVVIFPAARFPEAAYDPRRLPASPLRDLLVDQLEALVRGLDGIPPAAAERAVGQILELGAELLTPEPHRTGGPALRKRILQTIDEHLDDPELAPSTLARRHHVSLRYLHLLFEDGPSVGRTILARRLERCRGLLESRAGARLTISEVAFRGGFVSVPHFCRSFKSRFGVTPSQVRRRLPQVTSGH